MLKTHTQNLKSLWGTEHVGHRMLPTFFHTGITSVALDAVKRVGGFEPHFNSLWGFEDSFLGALLLTKEIKLVPCPSSVAFKIEHPEDETKEFDLEQNRRLFLENLHKKALSDFNLEVLREEINKLTRTRILHKVTYRRHEWRVEPLRRRSGPA